MIAPAPLPERIVLERTDSTNDEIRRRYGAGQTAPLWVAAWLQTQGRGRQGRHWATPEGNLAASRLLFFPASPAEASRLSFAVALAVADTIAGLAGDAPVSLKWPNDVLLSGKKVSGILLENIERTPTGELVIIIGIGLNLATHPPAGETTWPSTSIAAETGSTPPFDTALGLLADAVDTRLDQASNTSFNNTRREWLDRAAHKGKEIRVNLPDRSLTGRFIDLDDDGALVLEAGDGMHRIAAGDVFFPGGT